MKLFITGAGGFIGSTVVKHFSTLGWEIYGIGRETDLLQDVPRVTTHKMHLPNHNLSDLLCRQKPDVIVHAASSASVGRSVDKPLADFRDSVVVWANVLDAIRQSGVTSRVIFLSSAAVYGNPHYLPIDEIHPVNPVSPYGYHKYMCEKMADYYVKLYGLSICTARIFSAYGPQLRRQVIWDICKQLLKDNKVELSGSGVESRDFIHVEDVARAIACIAVHGNFNADVYNVASGNATSIHDLVHKLVHLFGEPVKVQFTGQSRSGDPLHWQADISHLSSTGFVCSKSLEHGLDEYIAWISQENSKERTKRLADEKASGGYGHTVSLL